MVISLIFLFTAFEHFWTVLNYDSGDSDAGTELMNSAPDMAELLGSLQRRKQGVKMCQNVSKHKGIERILSEVSTQQIGIEHLVWQCDRVKGNTSGTRQVRRPGETIQNLNLKRKEPAELTLNTVDSCYYPCCCRRRCDFLLLEPLLLLNVSLPLLPLLLLLPLLPWLVLQIVSTSTTATIALFPLQAFLLVLLLRLLLLLQYATTTTSTTVAHWAITISTAVAANSATDAAPARAAVARAFSSCFFGGRGPRISSCIDCIEIRLKLTSFFSIFPCALWDAFRSWEMLGLIVWRVNVAERMIRWLGRKSELRLRSLLKELGQIARKHSSAQSATWKDALLVGIASGGSLDCFLEELDLTLVFRIQPRDSTGSWATHGIPWPRNIM